MERMRSTIKSYSVWLDAIRGIAALVVFLGHARVVFIGSFMNRVPQQAPDLAAAAGKATEHAPMLTSFGHMAVIVFFVLSGYLVGGGAIRTLRNGRWSGSGYAIQRLSRLWTVLIPVLILGYLLDHIGVALAAPGSLYTAPPGQEMVFDTLPQAMTFPNMLLNAIFLQGIIGVPFGTNSPLWTLSYEFWFYMAFPFLMFAAAPGTTAARRALCVAVLAATGLFVGWRISFYFLFWLLGAAIEIAPQVLTPARARRIAPIGVVLFLAVLAAIIKSKPDILIADVIEAPCFALLCYVVVHLRHEVRRGMIVAAASGLSAISYTLYLVHAPIVAFASNLIMPVWRPWPVDAGGVARFGAVCLAIFLLAAGIWWLFERNTPKVRAAMTRGYAQLRQALPTPSPRVS